MTLTQDPAVQAVFDAYPAEVYPLIMRLRTLILDTADALPAVAKLTETLKWGEPSYKSPIGSTIRVGWSPKCPQQYGLFVTCSTNLLETYKTLYGDLFQYEGNRGLIFSLDDSLPEEALSHCISLALRYHKLKHLPLLGA